MAEAAASSAEAELGEQIGSGKGEVVEEETAHAYTLTLNEAGATAQAEIRLRGFRASDYYATNLNLTGFTNWFGSENLATMVADCAAVGPHLRTREAHVLELGCGLARAGLATAAAMRACDCRGRLVLTDGEPAMVALAKQNVARNGFGEGEGEGDEGGEGGRGAGAGERDCCFGCEARQLWWGVDEQCEALLAGSPDGFDMILGADLIYGKAQAEIRPLLHTVRALLRREPRAGTTQRADDDSGAAAAAVADDDDDTGAPTAEAAITTGYYVEPSSSAPEDPRPAFYLAFTRRDLPVEELTELADEYGLEWARHEDYNFDIFDNDAHFESDFWRDAIFVFRHKLAPPPPPPSPPAVAVAVAAADTEAAAAAAAAAAAL